MGSAWSRLGGPAFFIILNLLLQVAYDIGRFLDRLVAFLQLFDKQTINPHQFFMLLLEPLGAIDGCAHTLDLSLHLRLFLSPVVDFEFEVEVLLVQAVHLLVRFSRAWCATLPTSSAESGITTAIADFGTVLGEGSQR